eukprot:TRINITY_DN1840_c1_g1_i2.p1 TRINITY_DN1840_c1_g1~~TRINITY_DN1840_c1_g1_i2.p1  ORF type:complete len:222 (+),score=23.65 TRINITY_DN1840_c1_g1_i2:63-728(+)
MEFLIRLARMMGTRQEQHHVESAISVFFPEGAETAPVDVENLIVIEPGSLPGCAGFEDYSCGEPIDNSIIVPCVAAMLHIWVDNAPTAPISVFTGRASVSMTQFVSALVEMLNYIHCDYTILLTALCYIKRLSRGLYPVSYLNVFRLLLSSTLASLKFIDDIGISNNEFARLVCLELKDIGRLELNFMVLIRCQLYVSEAEYAAVYGEVRNMATLFTPVTA